MNYLTCGISSSFCNKSGFLSDFEGLLFRRLLFLIEGQGRNPCFERASAPERFSPRKSHRSAFKLPSKKVERFTLLHVPSDQKSIQKVQSLPSEKIKISQFLTAKMRRQSVGQFLAGTYESFYTSDC